MLLLILISCYFYYTQYRSKQKHLLPFNDILIDEKQYQNSLAYNISYKTLIGEKPLRTRFNNVEGFIRVYDETRYLVLFGPEKYDVIYNRIR